MAPTPPFPRGPLNTYIQGSDVFPVFLSPADPVGIGLGGPQEIPNAQDVIDHIKLPRNCMIHRNPGNANAR